MAQKQQAVFAAHAELATAQLIHSEKMREKGRQIDKMKAQHTKVVGALEKKAAKLSEEIVEKRQEALLKDELLRTERQQRQNGAGAGAGIAAPMPDRTRLGDLYVNEVTAGIYTAINGQLERKGMHAVLDTGNASLTMISQSVAKELGLIKHDGKPNESLKLTHTVRGVVSGASEQVWRVHAKIVIRCNFKEQAQTTLEGTVCVSPQDSAALGYDILLSATHIKELQRRGYGGVRIN